MKPKETDEVMAATSGNKKPRLDLQLHKQHSVCLVLDFGSQYTQLIARRVRENGVYSMLLPGDVTLVRAPYRIVECWLQQGCQNIVLLYCQQHQ